MCLLQDTSTLLHIKRGPVKKEKQTQLSLNFTVL